MSVGEMGLSEAENQESAPSLFRDLVAIARVDHWFKSLFMVPGMALATLLSPTELDSSVFGGLVVAVLATCLAASANYSINEWLDAEFDRHHPVKHARPAASGRLSAIHVYAQWAVLSCLSLTLSILITPIFTGIIAFFLVMGLIYNVRPIRAKDRAYLDVLVESVNNPIRLLLGWLPILPFVLPPSSVLLAYWMGGAYLMAVKRFSEYRFIGDPEQAGRYRASFATYTEDSLLLSAVFYAIGSSFFLGVFLIKYRIEYLLVAPALTLLFVWYLALGLRKDSVTQRPEKLYREGRFMAFVAFLGLLFVVLTFVDMPWMAILVNDHVLKP